MVTVPHQQSRLAGPCRAILASELFQSMSLGKNLVAHEFRCAGHLFTAVDHAPQNLIAITLQAIHEGKTAAVIPHQILNPDAIFFDMDATVIHEESLVEIAKAVGKEREIFELTERAMAGGMDFKESLRQRLIILRGIHRDQILAITPSISPGMKQLAEWCHQQQVPLFLVSGGFVDLAGPVAQQLGFKDFKANRFAWTGELMDGRVDGDIVDGNGKRDAVKDWCTVFNFDPKRCIAVGDGANDRIMMDYCGLAVGFEPKKALWQHLEVANHTGDHRFLMHAMFPAQPEDR